MLSRPLSTLKMTAQSSIDRHTGPSLSCNGHHLRICRRSDMFAFEFTTE